MIENLLIVRVTVLCPWARHFIHCLVLAHQIGISAVLTHMKKFYLTYPVPTRGKNISWTAASWMTRDVIVTLKWRNHAMLHHSIFRNSWKPFFKLWKFVFWWWTGKRIHYSCDDGIEKNVSGDQRLSSLCKPSDVNLWPSRRAFLSHLHTHDGFL